jgi:O-antigen ligase
VRRVISAIFAVSMLFLVGNHGPKVMIVVFGVSAVGIGAVVSGNGRLFCLWGLMLSMPLDLSFRVGPVFAKLGGETSFRFEVSDVFWVPLLLFLARDLWTRRLPGLRIPKVTFLWLAIAMLGMGSVLLGPWRMTAMHEVARMMKITLIFIVVVNELRTPERILHIAMALATGIVIQSFIGFAQYLTGGQLGLSLLGEADVASAEGVVKGGAVTRVGALLMHPVIFGTFLATLLPIALGQSLLKRERHPRFLFVMAILTGVPALILTLSRAGWLTFAVTSVVLATLIMFRMKLRRRALIPLAGAVIVVVGVGIAFAEPIMARIYSSTDISQRGRDEWAGDAKRMIAAKPILGFGLNSYAFAAPPYTRLGERGAREFYEKARFGGLTLMPVVHNAYLQWLAEIGVVGFVLHLSIFAVLLTMAWRNLRVQDQRLFMLNASCLAAFVGYLVDLDFGNSMRQGSTLREFWVLAAIVCAIRYWRIRTERSLAVRAPLPRAEPAPAQPAAT